MKNIILLSKNKNTIQEIINILKDNYNIFCKNLSDFSYFSQKDSDFIDEKKIKEAELLIIDISNFDFIEITQNKFFNKESNSSYFSYPESFEYPKLESSLNFKKNFLSLSEKKYSQNLDLKLFEDLKNIQIPKVLIISNSQKQQLFELLAENYNKFEDIILLNHLNEELLFKVSLILNTYNSNTTKDTIIIKDMVINLAKYELSIKGQIIELTFKEFELLKYLVNNEDKVFSRNILLSKIWGYDFYGGNRTVDVHMRRIRSKLPYPYDQMLKTIRNVGYMFSQKI
jgi:DNA-binding response OmpR family regulator